MSNFSSDDLFQRAAVFVLYIKTVTVLCSMMGICFNRFKKGNPLKKKSRRIVEDGNSILQKKGSGLQLTAPGINLDTHVHLPYPQIEIPVSATQSSTPCSYPCPQAHHSKIITSPSPLPSNRTPSLCPQSSTQLAHNQIQQATPPAK